MSLTELLIQARAKKADEFLFIVGSEPRVRTAAGWESLRNSPGLVTEWGLLKKSFLSDSEDKLLEQNGFLRGEAKLENLRVGFSFFEVKDTKKVVLSLDLEREQTEVQLPPSIFETCLRMKGLVILAGLGETGPRGAIYKVLQRLGEEKSFSGVVLSKKSFPRVAEKNATFVYHVGEFSESQQAECLLDGVDMVVFEGYENEECLQDALALAEQGLFVIYAMKAPSVTNALRRCVSSMRNHFGDHGPARLSEVMTVIAGQYPLLGVGGECVYAHEVLLIKPQVKNSLEREDMRSLEEMMASSADSAGILTLNQSLLQHLVRRRISLRAAFEASRDPDSLDQLLKKVGI